MFWNTQLIRDKCCWTSTGFWQVAAKFGLAARTAEVSCGLCSGGPGSTGMCRFTFRTFLVGLCNVYSPKQDSRMWNLSKLRLRYGLHNLVSRGCFPEKARRMDSCGTHF